MLLYIEDYNINTHREHKSIYARDDQQVMLSVFLFSWASLIGRNLPVFWENRTVLNLFVLPFGLAFVFPLVCFGNDKIISNSRQ